MFVSPSDGPIQSGIKGLALVDANIIWRVTLYLVGSGGPNENDWWPTFCLEQGVPGSWFAQSGWPGLLAFEFGQIVTFLHHHLIGGHWSCPSNQDEVFGI